MAAGKKTKTKKITIAKTEPQPVIEPDIKIEDIKIHPEQTEETSQLTKSQTIPEEEKVEPVAKEQVVIPQKPVEEPKVQSAGKEPVVNPDQSTVVIDAKTPTIQVMENAVTTQPVVADVPSAESNTQNVNPLDDFKKKMETELNMPDKPRKNYMWPILFIFIFAIALFAGVFAYRQGVFEGLFAKKEVAVTPTPVPPTATPEPTLAEADLSEYEVQILNGSEVSGEASRQKDSLEAEGFTIASVGNADESNYTDTIIQAKKNVGKAFIAKLKSVLEETFDTIKTKTLDEDSSVPVVVILGIKK
jgi:hypothetical protein